MTMKINNTNKNDILARLEEFAHQLNETAQRVVIQDPQGFAEQVRKKGAELFILLKSTFFRGRARISRPEFLRSRIKKRVMENLEDGFQYPEVADVITDVLIQAAKEDPYYRQLLDLEENLA
jgi:hypothetical protein